MVGWVTGRASSL